MSREPRLGLGIEEPHAVGRPVVEEVGRRVVPFAARWFFSAWTWRRSSERLLSEGVTVVR